MKKFKIDFNRLIRNWDNLPWPIQFGLVILGIALAVMYIMFFVCTLHVIVKEPTITVFSLEVIIAWLPFYTFIGWLTYKLFNGVVKIESVEKPE